MAVVHWNVGKHCYDEWVDGLGLAETLGESNDAFPVVTVAGQESDICTARQGVRLDVTGSECVAGVCSSWWSHDFVRVME